MEKSPECDKGRGEGTEGEERRQVLIGVILSSAALIGHCKG